mmetsp:Transcript_10928/g.23145  ORF Transcript_10928/g.23145 Transcript_10928/m.23145 type:complete len:483 (+) Transcript_10928:88-1536(+)
MQHNIKNPEYKNFMNGCYQQGHAGGNKHSNKYFAACDRAEQDRLQMNMKQPKEMQNYTHAGYAKVETPSKVIELLEKFWKKNNQFVWPEFWNDDNTYVNHWEAPTSLLDIGRKDVSHPFTNLEYETIVESIQDVLESWTNQRLVLTSAYGIRVYGEGAILAPHVDRLPLVSSAIINVFQHNVSEPWILEVIGHDGMAHNLTATPGDMILYESASIIHGRPYPLKGEGSLYGSLFVHFEPLYHTLRHAQNAGDHYSAKKSNDDSKNAFEKALKEQLEKPSLEKFHTNNAVGRSKFIAGGKLPNWHQSVPTSPKRPAYVWPEYESLYDQKFYFEYNKNVYPKSSKMIFKNLNAGQAASLGELDALMEIAKTQGRMELFKGDVNGWKPIHEAARSGHAHILEYLLKEGAKVNERTNFNDGGNALYWANKLPKQNAKAIAVLKKYGGVSVPPLTRKTSSAKLKDKTTTSEDGDKKDDDKKADENDK